MWEAYENLYVNSNKNLIKTLNPCPWEKKNIYMKNSDLCMTVQDTQHHFCTCRPCLTLSEEFIVVMVWPRSQRRSEAKQCFHLTLRNEWAGLLHRATWRTCPSPQSSSSSLSLQNGLSSIVVALWFHTFVQGLANHQRSKLS